LLAILLIVFIGNLEGTGQLMRDFASLSTSNFQSTVPGLQTLVLSMGGFFHILNGSTLATYNYWDPTRVIPETINEFPFFSFLFADLHPHMIGLPFTVLFLSLTYNWLRPNESVIQRTRRVDVTDDKAEISVRSFVTSQIGPVVHWLALPFVLGAVAVINTWDLPTYLGLMLAIFLLSRYRQIDSNVSLRQAGLLLVQGLIFAAALLAVTYLLYLPFFANYQAIDVGLGLVRNKTPLDQHLKIWGFFLLVIVTWLVVSLLHPATRNGLLRAISLGLRRWNVWPHLSEIWRKLIEPQTGVFQLGLWGMGGVLLVSVVLAILGYWVPAYLLPLVILALMLLLRREVTTETSFLGVLIFTGLLILLGVEFFFLRDFLGGGAYYRMNTLFKFFIQVWVMFGLVVAVALPQLWQWAWRWSWPAQLAWRGAVLVLLMASLIYPVLGTRTRVDDRFPGDDNRPAVGTLDGLAYMTVGTFEWPAGNPIELKYDYEAIRWLQDNVAGTPVIAEAKVGYYREGGMRVAAYTGLPSVLGGLHQNEQRYASQVGDRDFVVSEFWSTPDPNRALELINQLGIDYIYVGQIERVTHGAYIEEKFEQLHQQGALELVFENERTKIYRVVKQPEISSIGEERHAER
jgi:YYY domain-containing protein